MFSRRRFLAHCLASGGSFAASAFWTARHANASSGYGPLAEPDANGIRLPSGFISRVVATAFEAPIEGTAFQWHPAPDGGATFPLPDGGWIYVSNSEVFSIGNLSGGASALRFSPQGDIVDAYSILSDTTVNCAGGPTPWGTWLSCEEFDGGRVWECDPTGANAAVVRPALGTFRHEAVAVDPIGKRLYLTEDKSDGRLYRFSPTSYPDLNTGILAVAEVLADPGPGGALIWHPVSNPNPLIGVQTETRYQVSESTAFKGGEGIWFHEGIVYFVTKGDNRVWALDTLNNSIDVIYDPTLHPNPILSGVDNVTVSPRAEVVVAEDGGDMQLIALTPDGELCPLLQVTGQEGSEITGPAFSPDGRRLYFSSQRGGSAGFGITYEVSGPFTNTIIRDSFEGETAGLY